MSILPTWLPRVIVYTAPVLLLAYSHATHAQKAYAIDESTGFRMERYRAPVPDSVPGGETVDTPVVESAWNRGDAVLIDVWPPTGLGADPLDGRWQTSDERLSIPGAVWLPEVGRGFLEPAHVDYFKRNLVRLSNDSLETMLVFFCTADCWQSWNAAKRAADWGYSQVHWYPLGTDGWQEFELPLAEVQPVNFINDTTPASAFAFPERAGIHLIDQSGKEIPIGNVTFQATENGATAIAVNVGGDDPFSDHFLSMRPFRCLTGDKEWYCYLSYPYALDNIITPDDLVDLEYQLMFILKRSSEHGIDAWNGLYYKLELTDTGTMEGQLLQGDLNVLQSPPDDGVRPVDLSEFIIDSSAKRRFPRLLIKP